jgi:uncharacterized protein
LIWLTKAAQAGHQWAQTDLGKRLLNSDGVPFDDSIGREWLQRAADQGHAEALTILENL